MVWGEGRPRKMWTQNNGLFMTIPECLNLVLLEKFDHFPIPIEFAV